VEQIAFDGMRKHLLKDFTRVYHLHFEGNVRQNPKLRARRITCSAFRSGLASPSPSIGQAHRPPAVLSRVDKHLKRAAKCALLDG
jgi:hypothetical protein